MEKVTLFPNKNRTAWGIRYLMFQLLVLPTLLYWLTDMLGLPLNESRMNLLYYTVNFAALVAIYWRFLQISLRHAAENIATVLMAAAFGFLVYQASTTALDMATAYFFPDFFNINDSVIAQMAREHFPMWAFATVVLVPPAEELLFRGALFGGLYSRNKYLAWVVSVLGFALIHVLGYVDIYSWDVLLICTLQYLPAGICLAGAYRFSGNILAPIAMHCAINVLGILSIAPV